MSDSERRDVVNYLAVHPKAGNLLEGTGGGRKLRWGRGWQGKSAGVRVIYHFHSEAGANLVQHGFIGFETDRHTYP